MDLSALSGQLIPENWTDSTGTSESVTSSTTSTKKVLDAQLLAAIMSGLTGQMTDKEIAQYAENLLKPQLNAGIEAAQQAYETTKLSKEQEIENLAAALTRSIMEQEGAYKQNMAAVETAALARGMGRSSYTLESLANQGTLYAEVIRQLTEDTGRQQQQIQAQISQAAQQNAQTQGRLNTDYAATLAAKIQELKQSQQQAYNQNYLIWSRSAQRWAARAIRPARPRARATSRPWAASLVTPTRHNRLFPVVPVVPAAARRIP